MIIEKVLRYYRYATEALEPEERDLSHTKGLVMLALPENSQWMGWTEEGNKESALVSQISRLNTIIFSLYVDQSISLSEKVSPVVNEMFAESTVGQFEGKNYAKKEKVAQLYRAHLDQLVEDLKEADLESVLCTILRMKALIYIHRKNSIPLPFEFTPDIEVRCLYQAVVNEIEATVFSLWNSSESGRYGQTYVDDDLLEKLKYLSDVLGKLKPLLQKIPSISEIIPQPNWFEETEEKE